MLQFRRVVNKMFARGVYIVRHETYALRATVYSIDTRASWARLIEAIK
jgi:hypothetical protein